VSGLNSPRFLLGVSLLREGISSFDQFPYCVPAIRHLETLSLDQGVTFFIGENGTGKSTLLEGIAIKCGMNPEGGGRNFNFATRPSHSALDASLRLTWSMQRPSDTFFLRAESFYNVATEVDELAKQGGGFLSWYGGKSLHDQSHGESFYALMQHRFVGHGLYLMDEPEAALSPTRQLGLLAIMHNHVVETASQFIIATHSPIIMGYPGARIYEFTEEGIREVAYRETDHYQVTRRFLDNPEKMLSILFSQEQS
jgi:predicted ATPase